MKNVWKIRVLGGVFGLGCHLAFAGVVYDHPDHLGSSLALTNQNGEIAEAILYAPFGEALHESVAEGLASVSFLYTGQEFDPVSDLYNYGARYYDPILNYFIRIDPAERNPGETQSLNPYVYAIHNPVGYRDPDGKEPQNYSSLWGAFSDQYRNDRRKWGEPFKVPSLYGEKLLTWIAFPADIRWDSEGKVSFTLRPIDPETGEEFFVKDPGTGILHRNALEIQLPSLLSSPRNTQKDGMSDDMRTLADAYHFLRGFSLALDNGCAFIRFELDDGKSVEFNMRTGVFVPVNATLGAETEVRKVVLGLNLISEEEEKEEPTIAPVYAKELPSPYNVLDLLTTLNQAGR